jgi:hypothetical protein
MREEREAPDNTAKKNSRGAALVVLTLLSNILPNHTPATKLLRSLAVNLST